MIRSEQLGAINVYLSEAEMINGNQGFETTINKVVRMPQESELCDRVRILGLNVVNVMWEDTARTAGSVWGPNITDMTLQVRHGNNSQKKELLPVIRYPNFTDKTGDVPLEYVYLKEGIDNGEDTLDTGTRRMG
ncbi:MAG: hypothetical protein J7545_21090 [Roseofilum sp. SBFL]|uniref:hypothetical protein n=1 Tax=unclassified Roseofilum TaxID=2620099 RepID=UPI001B084C45|nr:MULTISPECIES: hypothetical protein [unclassified Roseofilum]MBP0012103.1 hypothetical protein [Roseofilum sp. SID3]MBP0023907.1 hypothetical protein [Roseofilum sp. SID2]MBP0039529.1 hypothetical protein [Roseofilum sp. SID1]MBP0044437.1 hypothetical protein [Roseofilum sp. SBFL]